jgi:hypothetical protein
MAVYIDAALIPFQHPITGSEMLMSHMIADSLDELHEMADLLGLKREWFQNKRTPHYDVCKTKRERALKLGVKEVNRHDCADLIKQWQEAKASGQERIKGVFVGQGELF